MIKKQVISNKILIITVIFGLIIILTSLSGVNATSTVYVNVTGGDDSNSGTIDHPYKTINMGINSAAGGMVIIADGIYTGNGNTNLKINRNMTIVGQHKKQVTIDGKGINQIFIITKDVTVSMQNLLIINGFRLD